MPAARTPRPRVTFPGQSLVRLDSAVAAAHRVVARVADPRTRLKAYGVLLEALNANVRAVAAERDRTIVEVLGAADAPSHRDLAGELGISRQRVDKLAKLATQRPRKRSKSLSGPR